MNRRLLPKNFPGLSVVVNSEISFEGFQSSSRNIPYISTQDYCPKFFLDVTIFLGISSEVCLVFFSLVVRLGVPSKIPPGIIQIFLRDSRRYTRNLFLCWLFLCRFNQGRLIKDRRRIKDGLEGLRSILTFQVLPWKPLNPYATILKIPERICSKPSLNKSQFHETP